MKRILRNLFTISIVFFVGCASPATDKNAFLSPVVSYGDDLYIGENSGLYLFQKNVEDGCILSNAPAFSLSMGLSAHSAMVKGPRTADYSLFR